MSNGKASLLEDRVPRADAGPVMVRCTAPDALSNLVSVLELIADGQVRCTAGSRRPSAASMKLVEDALVAGDFYDTGEEPISAFAWPVLIQAGGLARLAGCPARAFPAWPRGAGQPVVRGAGRPVGPVAGERIER